MAKRPGGSVGFENSLSSGEMIVMAALRARGIWVLSRASNPELLKVEKIQCADRHDYVTGP